ncbi:porin [Geomonas azotofigens]|uniref:porin n=1 Tax=Geomonas azotofigens TaxID=2843196 RepID=UPI001C121AF7|nr:porin [Geomonas azotofigens]MBU5611796.1 OprO/OprP family phosphate-selective porin [Geomonas azotofigens]
MKKQATLAMAGVLAVLAAGNDAQAKSLEDILKEKGVITEAEYKEASKAQPLDYKLGKGFVFTSPDQKFQLQLGGQIQAQYELDNYEVPNKQDVSQFNLRRVKTLLSGYAFTKDLTYKATYNWANVVKENSKAMEEVNMKYRVADELQVMFGQEKIQYSRQWITSNTAQQFVDGSFVRNAFMQGYDTGINLHGDLWTGVVKYDAGVFGGAGQNTKNKTGDNAYAFRLAFNPLGDMKYGEGDLEYSKKPLVSLGSSYYLNTVKKTVSGTGAAATSAIDNNNSNFVTDANGWLGTAVKAKYFGTKAAEDISVDSWEADFACKWLGASMQGEYFWGKAVGETSGKELIAKGGYVQAGYFVIPQRLELALRYAWMDPNRQVSNDSISEIQGAVNYFLYGNNLKIQGDVGNRHTYKGQVDDLVARAQVQLLF